MPTQPNPNGLRVVTGGGMGTIQAQWILIKVYDTPFTVTPLPNDPYLLISNPNDSFSQIIQVVQNFAEIYFIGNPEPNSGGETDLTRIAVMINPNTENDSDNNTSFPTAAGRWTTLEAALDAQFSTSGTEVWYGIPYGWSWFYDD